MSAPANVIRIAMWSGPRNISTAMMRSWSSRPDTFVVDEPFYSFYLEATGKNHPGAGEIIAAGETDWRKIVVRLTKEPVPPGKHILFQKQMTHHLLPEIDRDWIVDVTNYFLIRNPREVILSYVKKNAEPTLDDLGFVQQRKIFEFVRDKTKSSPAVIDATDVLKGPERLLRLLCKALGVEFIPAMLCWPPGLRATDGIWAKYWYEDAARSTSFQAYQPKEGAVPDRLREVYELCRECYERLYECRLH